uniref:Uncharacterized protein n=1 Tax=Anguilla anguilla TaxID=7936 RepID=A0A0E9UE72_ANGAN
MMACEGKPKSCGTREESCESQAYCDALAPRHISAACDMLAL